MEQGGSKSKLILISIAIVVVWFLFFGVRLIGYFLSIRERGFRETECAGCSDVALLLSTTWTFSFFIIIPLIIPLALVG